MRIKKIILPVIFAAFVVLLSACAGNVSPTATERTETQTEPTEAPTEQTTPTDYEALYADVLTGFHAAMLEDNDEYEGVMGAAEAVKVGKNVGYAISDISGDGIPELIIGADSAEADGGTELCAVYTAVNGKAFFVFEGSARNAYRLTADGNVVYYGSGGAMNTACGTYRFSDDGTSLTCESFYFTAEDEEVPCGMSVYRNASGVWDTEASEKTDMLPDDFTQFTEKAFADPVFLELIPFAE